MKLVVNYGSMQKRQQMMVNSARVRSSNGLNASIQFSLSSSFKSFLSLPGPRLCSSLQHQLAHSKMSDKAAARRQRLRSSRTIETQLSSSTTTLTSSSSNQAQKKARTNPTGAAKGSNDKAKWSRKGKERAIGQGSGNILSTTRPLPGAIDVEKFVNSRAFEIQAIQTSMRSAAAASTTRAFQSLPRHLRRRAASHNPRRVPKRLRSKATAEIDSKDQTTKVQKKRAKLRARGGISGVNVTERWRRRQQDKIWLETHVWHAKRMKMETMYGYRLGLTPTLKSHRPAYRAARRSCIIHDASYYSIMELSGSRNDLVKVLIGVIGGGNPWTGSKYESGGRMAEVTFYRYQQWPLGLLGPGEVIWRPSNPSDGLESNSQKGKRKRNDDEEKLSGGRRHLWIRVHPQMFEDVYQALCKSIKDIMSSKNQTKGDLEGDDIMVDGDVTQDNSKLEIPIHLADLRGDVNAFELMGPKAIKVLRGIIKLAKGQSPEKRRFWEALHTLPPVQALPSNMVVGLIAEDPRLSFPPENLKTTADKMRAGDQASTMRDLAPSSALAVSDLWAVEKRETLFVPRFKKADLDRRRNKHGVPGVKLHPTPQDDQIPIMVIRRTVGTSQQRHAFDGFTLYTPAGWGMPFWQSLVYTGSLVGGIKERNTQSLESSSPAFPIHYPLTSAGQQYWEDRADKEHLRWKRKPPAKRPNFDKLGVKYPWLPDMKAILPGSDDQEPWLATGFLGSLSTLVPIAQSADPARTFGRAIASYRVQNHLPPLDAENTRKLYESACIIADVEMPDRGSPKDMAEVYLVKEGENATLVGFCLSGNYSLTTGKGHALAVIRLSQWIATKKSPNARNQVRKRNDGVFRDAILTPVIQV